MYEVSLKEQASYSIQRYKMPGDTSCLVCKNSQSNDAGASFHRFHSGPERKSVWLNVLKLSERDLKSYSRVCSSHFPEASIRELQRALSKLLMKYLLILKLITVAATDECELMEAYIEKDWCWTTHREA